MASENLERAWKIPTQRHEIASAKAKEAERRLRWDDRRGVGCWSEKQRERESDGGLFESVKYCGMSI